MKASYFMPIDKINQFMQGAAMNSQYGIQVFGICGPAVKDMLPPPLELTDPENPMFFAYIVNIREPTFSPWYMEGGVGVMARYGDKVGVYFMGLQLSGPGALMGAFSGREGSGLPKKLCERIVVERMDDWGHCFIERKGVRLIDVEVKIGEYNDPAFHQPQEACAPGNPVTTDGACLLHRYRITDRFSDMEILHYDSPTRFNSWEKATATVKLCSSLDDPWGDIPLVKVLGAGWMVSDNGVKGLSTLYRYPDGAETDMAMQYLFAGRYDQCTICSSHQRYE